MERNEKSTENLDNVDELSATRESRRRKQRSCAATIAAIRRAPLSTHRVVVYNTFASLAWAFLLCIAAYYFATVGLSNRCGWDGANVVCYMGVWEKISRASISIVSFLQLLRAKDVFGADAPSVSSFNIRRWVGQPLLVLAIIGFDGMHHKNQTLRPPSTCVYLLSWTLFEASVYASRASRASGACPMLRHLHDFLRSWMPLFITVSESAVLLEASFVSRRIFALEPLNTEGELWREREGAGNIPGIALLAGRHLSTLYAAFAAADVSKRTVLFLRGRLSRKGGSAQKNKAKAS
eukprot:g1133.t1